MALSSDPKDTPGKNTKKLDPVAHFTVPEGYFDELKTKVFERIALSSEEDDLATLPVEKKRPLHVVIRPYLYLAAMFVGMALMFKALPLIIPAEQPLSTTATVRQVTEEEFVQELSEEEFNQLILDETQDEYLLATVFE